MNMKHTLAFLTAVALWTGAANQTHAEIGIISPVEAKKLIEHSDPSKRPIVLDTRGGYKDYFRGHLPTAHHLEFDTLRGTDNGVPVQYLPPDITKQLLVRAGVNKDRTHIVYATGESLPNDEILSASMVAFVLEKYGISDIRIVDGGLPGWKAAGFTAIQDYFGNPPGKLPAKGNPEIALNIDDVLKKKDKSGNVLVDARPMNEYLGQDEIWLRKGHIPGAINIDVNDSSFAKKVAALDKNKTYLVHCAAGVRSAKACGKLAPLGFTSLYDLAPGFNGWKKAGKPTEK